MSSQKSQLAAKRMNKLLLVVIALLLGLLWWQVDTKGRKRIRRRQPVAATPGPRFPIRDDVTVLKDDVYLDCAATKSVAISPDMRQIAYSDGGQLISQFLPDGPPTILAESVGSMLGLRWSRDSKQVSYSTPCTDNPNHLELFVVSPKQRSTSVAVVPGKPQTQLVLSESGQHVVAFLGNNPPEIWTVSPSKPCLCIYERLIPSTTSDQLLGVEIDTHQLVVVNSEFEIVRRIDYFFENSRFAQLVWSAEGQCAYRLLGHSRGQRVEKINLQTGDVETWNVGSTISRMTLTGRSDEIASIDGGSLVISRLFGKNTDFEWRFEPPLLPRIRSGKRLSRSLDLRYTNYFSSDCRFAVVIEQADESDSSSWRHRLVERSGKSWIVEATLGAPQPLMLGFGDEDKVLIALVDERLVSIPLQAIMNDSGDTSDEGKAR